MCYYFHELYCTLVSLHWKKKIRYIRSFVDRFLCAIILSVLRTSYNTASDQHKSTYLPFNQPDTRFHLFFRKTQRGGWEGESRIDMFICDIDYRGETTSIEEASWRGRSLKGKLQKAIQCKSSQFGLYYLV
jgi:hypothetical protein